MAEALFRADSSLRMGTGHVVRCLSLADELRSFGVTSRFVTRLHDGNILDAIRKRGYEAHALPAPASIAPGATVGETFLGVPWEQDAEETTAVAARLGGRFDWVIADHYGLDARWERRFRTVANKVMAIDDLFDRPHDSDLLLNQSFLTGAERYRGLTPAGSKVLVGPQFALLRPQFAELHDRATRRVGPVDRVLILFGGVDETNITAQAVRVVASLDRPPARTDVVVGLRYPYRESLEALVRKVPGAVLHVQVEDPAPLMAAADLAIGAGGTTTWERCCLGLPSLVVAVAANQFDLSKGMADAGYIHYLGPAEGVTEATIAAAYAALEAPAARREMAERGPKLVDGRGARRVAEAMFPHQRKDQA